MSDIGTNLFSQKKINIDKVENSFSSTKLNLDFDGFRYLIIDDAHLKALLSLYVHQREVFLSSACVVVCMIPRWPKLFRKSYYVNRIVFLLRIVRRLIDFTSHMLRPVPRRLYSGVEEGMYQLEVQNRVVGGVLERLGQEEGLSFEIVHDIDRDRVRRALSIPISYKISFVVCLGYKIEGQNEQRRQIVQRNTFELP